MSEPKINRRPKINIYVDQEVVDTVAKIAKQEHRTVSQQAFFLLELGMAHDPVSKAILADSAPTCSE